MTAAVDVLAAVRALGGEVKVANPGRLKIIAPAPLPHELIEQLRAAKPDLLTLLAPPEAQSGASDTWLEVCAYCGWPGAPLLDAAVDGRMFAGA